MLHQYRLRDYNFILIGLIIAICVMGVLLVGSAEDSLQSKQFLGCIAGFFIMIVISLIDFSWILNFYWILYIINIGLLAFVYVAGKTSHGASRWLTIGGDSGFTFQPTELAKIILILFFAMYFMKHENDLNTPKTLFKSILLIGAPLLMILIQPDLKNTITIGIIFLILIYVAGLNYKTLGKAILIIALVLITLFILIVKTDIKIVDDYQKQRILSFLEPENELYNDNTIQQENSVVAIGSGQLTGKGLDNSDTLSSNKGNFVAEVQNDFIFAVAGEELGFVGCIAIILLIFFIILECTLTALKAKNLSGKLICSGMAALIGIQSFINICVAVGLLPNTGTPLPFVSYGLSSLWSLFIGMGMVLNVGLQKNRYSRKAGLINA